MMSGRRSPSCCMTPKPVPSLSWRSRMMTSTLCARAAATAEDSSATAATTSTSSSVSRLSRRRSASTRESSTSRTFSTSGELLDESVAERVRGDVGIRLEVHLLEHPASIRAHGLHGKAQLLRDLRHGTAARELAEDLELTLRELLVNRPVRATIVDLGDQQLRHRGAQITPSRQDHMHRFQQVVRRAL